MYTYLVDGEAQERHLTHAELDHRARAIASELQSRGGPGQRVLVVCPPGLEFVAAFFGCLYAGNIGVPIPLPVLAKLGRDLPRLAAIAADARASVALTTVAALSLLQGRTAHVPGLGGVEWLAVDQIPGERADAWEDPRSDGDTVALLQYTSGSTAEPKAVILTHRQLLANSEAIAHCFGHTPDLRGVIWLPPYHDMGLIGGVLGPLYVGGCVTLMSPVSVAQRPLRWLAAISRTRGTTSGGPNFAYDLCVSKIPPEQRAGLDLSSWEVAFNGAEPVRPETIERFTEAFEPYGFRREAFLPCYGLAEATLLVSSGLKGKPPVTCDVQGAALERHRVVPATAGDPGARILVSCGFPPPDAEIAIVDPDSAAGCPPARIGEIWVAGPSVAAGYWNRDAETERCFRAYRSDTGEGPYLRTGDLGFVKDGELFITGRIKDLIILGGRNHDAEDVEHTVEGLDPSLHLGRCATFSIEVDGEEQLVVAVEVHSRALDAEAIVRAIRRAIAEEHGVRASHILMLKPGGIPRTSSGKLRRRACRAAMLEGWLDVVATGG